MVHTEPDPLRELSEAFERWKWLLPPIGDLRDSKRITYPIELDLDHEVSSLSGVGNDALQGNTKPDWQKVVPEYLANLDMIERNVDLAPIPEEQKKNYKEYISECRLVWEKIAQLTVPAEGHLGFREHVLAEFRFLEKKYGFRVAETTPIRVRYESPELFVELNYSPSAPELSFELGRLLEAQEHQQFFSLDDLGYWAGLGLRFNYDLFDLGSRVGLAGFIARIAEFVARYADPILHDDSSSFQSLIAKQTERERRLPEALESWSD